MHMFWIGRCPEKGCGHAERHEDVVNARTFGHCPDHGTYRLERGIGYVSGVKCGARCTNAVGPSCDCSCGGHNHGMAHAAPVSGASSHFHVCARCGQTVITRAAVPMCETCRRLERRAQGTQEALFEPAPTQIPGQLTL